MPSDGKSSHCLWQGELKGDLLRPGEIQLDLTRLGMSPWCQGRYIISLYNIRRQVEIIIKSEDTPAFIFYSYWR
jgi:hypothetical protein